MALAILELAALDRGQVQFNINTGTNRYYQLRIGSRCERRYGLDWVEGITYRTPITLNDGGGSPLRYVKQVALPESRFSGGAQYVQLFSFKTAEGAAAAFSTVVHVGRERQRTGAQEVSAKFSISKAMRVTTPLLTPRAVSCRTAPRRYAQTASLDDLLGTVLRIAQPALLELLRGAAQDIGRTAAAGSQEGPAAILNQVLQAITANAAGAASSRQQSLAERASPSNRFSGRHEERFSQPFILPALIPLLPALVGPLVQALPELMNAANQKRLDLKREDNKLVTDILGGINQRLLMDQILQTQRVPAGAASNQSDMTALLELLQRAAAQSPPAAPSGTGAAAAPTPVAAQSLRPLSGVLSRRAVLTFVAGPSLDFQGGRRAMFVQDRAVQLRVRLDVAPPAPTAPLSRAILTCIVKDAETQDVLLRKSQKCVDLRSGQVMSVPLALDDLARLPCNRSLVACAELRWPSGRTTTTRRALGSLDLVLIRHHAFMARGRALGRERELVDIGRYRAFWNKIWESPSLAARRDGEGKLLWEIDADLKYVIALSADHVSNGLTDTRLLRSQQDADTVSERITGRMKAGMEVSLNELNKLLPMWDGVSPWDSGKLDALRLDAFVVAGGGQFMQSVRLKGRKRQTGMIWVIPILDLFEVRLGTVQQVDEFGQVTALEEQPVLFPLPVAARLLGLKSREDGEASEADEESGQPDARPAGDAAQEDVYHFSGYEIEFSNKVALLPSS